MVRDRQIQVAAALVLAVSLAGAGVMATQVSASAGRNKLVYADTAEAGEAPEVALGIAMGAFRGIFVNFLWIRANNLKEDGRHYEAVELAKAITRLQPRFPRVWVFHAWNLSYNISVMTQTARERWKWVNAGLALLRDQAIPANPNDLLLHKELAYIYLHKIQGITDDANGYYKREIAKEWHIVLGPPPQPDPSDRSRDLAVKRYVQWLTPIAEAPATLEEVYAKEPAARALVERIREASGDALDSGFLQRYAMHTALEGSGRADTIRASMGPNHQAFAALLRDPALKPAFDALVPFVRRNVLRDTYKMDVRKMIRDTEKYGPIDWRHPAAHALYWSTQGVERALTRWTEQNKRDFDFVNTDRMTVQAVQELWRSGEIYFSFLDSLDERSYVFYLAAPNANFIKTYGEILDELVQRSWVDSKDRAYSFYNAGYENFMKDAIRFMYRRGQIAEAQKMKDDLAVWEGQNTNDPARIDHFAKPLAEFVMWDLGDRFTSPNVANAEIISSLMGAYATGLLTGDTELFTKQFEYAKSFHRYFMQEQLRKTLSTPMYERMAVFDPNFPMLAGNVFAQFMSFLNIDQAEIAYDAAPMDLRRFAYDLLAEQFKQGMDNDKMPRARKFDEVFPEPEGMEAHRTAFEAYIRARFKESSIEER